VVGARLNRPMSVPHPRLLITPAHLKRLREPVTLPVLQDAQREVEEQAEQFVASRKLKYNPDLHNALLRRAREMQTRIVTLLVRWKQTDDERFRAAVLNHVRDMAEWEHWCWEAQIQTPDPHRSINRLYDLSSGENSTTLALAYDLLASTLTAEERAIFVTMARTRCFEPFLTVLKSQPAPPGQWLPGWWFKAGHSNWNTVCAGGAGLLALAMREEFPGLADEVIERVEESILPNFSSLAHTHGGWVEGIGYWNYGHRYGFLYLLGHERATGRPHPCLALPGVKETLSFPLDFTPNGQFCSFPDVNVWWPLPFHYEAAVRLDRPELVPVLDRCQPPREAKVRWWGDAAELLLFHPRAEASEIRFETDVARRYPGMDWALLADRMPEPRLYMSIRGGSTKDPHAMVDVLSFHVVVGNEKFIENLSNRGGDDYLETTFSARRNDLFEMNQPAKNVLFINGVGLPAEARAEMSAWTSGKAKGFRLDATGAFGFLGENSPMADFCGRLFLMLDSKAFLILDRFELPRPGRVETRMHSHAALAETGGTGFLLRGNSGQLRVAYACTVDAVTATAVTCPTKPVPGANVLRWCTAGRTHRQVTMATLLSPGGGKAKVWVQDGQGIIEVRVVTETLETCLSVSDHLE
jgi:hypothetical protein